MQIRNLGGKVILKRWNLWKLRITKIILRNRTEKNPEKNRKYGKKRKYENKKHL